MKWSAQAAIRWYTPLLLLTVASMVAVYSLPGLSNTQDEQQPPPLAERTVADRTAVLVGEIHAIEVQTYAKHQSPRPKRLTRISLTLDGIHGPDSGTLVDVVTFAAIRGEGQKVLLTSRSGSPSMLLRPGEKVVVRVVQGTYFGEGSDLYGCLTVAEYYVVGREAHDDASAPLFATRLIHPGKTLEAHYVESGEIDYSRLEYHLEPVPEDLESFIRQVASDLGISEDELMKHPYERSTRTRAPSDAT